MIIIHRDIVCSKFIRFFSFHWFLAFIKTYFEFNTGYFIAEYFDFQQKVLFDGFTVYLNVNLLLLELYPLSFVIISFNLRPNYYYFIHHEIASCYRLPRMNLRLVICIFVDLYSGIFRYLDE